MPMRRKLNINNKGQGLVETTLAIGVILIGLGAIMVLTIQNVGANALSSQRIVALNLVREGVDAVRAIRDSNWLKAGNSDSSANWFDGLVPTGIYEGARLLVTPPSGNLPLNLRLEFSPPNASANDRTSADTFYRVYRDTSAMGADKYLWQQLDSPGGDLAYTGYNRMIYIDPVCRTSAASPAVVYDDSVDCKEVNEEKVGIRVTIEVSWVPAGSLGSSSRKKISAVEYLYNWK